MFIILKLAECLEGLVFAEVLLIFCRLVTEKREAKCIVSFRQPFESKFRELLYISWALFPCVTVWIFLLELRYGYRMMF